MKIILQGFGIALICVYLYSAYYVIRDAFDPIPEYPHRIGSLGTVRATAFFLGTGGLVAWVVESLTENWSVFAGLLGFAAASGTVYLLMEFKRRGLAEMESQADKEGRKILDDWRPLHKDRIAKQAQELKAELHELRRKLSLEGEIGRQLSRYEWITLWRNEIVLTGIKKFYS